MKIEKVQAEITNVNPRKENGEDGGVLASDISVRFAVPRSAVDDMLPGDGFTDQFYKDDDTRLECVYPIVFGEKIKDLRITLHIGSKPMVFEASKIAAGMKLTPQVGQYIQVECKFQVYPTSNQSGKLDEAVKEYIDIEVAPMTGDILAAVA